MAEPLTLEELRKVSQSLKMDGFASIDDESVLDKIRFQISDLPSAEELDNLSDNAEALKNIGEQVGKIAQLIERVTRRDESYKVRNMARKNLPPRYQVLEWRQNMKQETANLVKNMVKTSARADDLGHADVAAKVLKCTKLVMAGKAQQKDVQEVIIALRSAGMEKEAGMWDQFKGFMGGVGGEVAKIGKGIWQAGQAGGLEAEYNALYKQISKFKNTVDTLAGKAQDPNVQTRMQNLSKQISLSEQTIAKAAEAVKAVDTAAAGGTAGATPAAGGITPVDMSAAGGAVPTAPSPTAPTTAPSPTAAAPTATAPTTAPDAADLKNKVLQYQKSIGKKGLSTDDVVAFIQSLNK